MADRKPIPVACTLGAVDAEQQLAEWAELRGRAVAVSRLDDGVRLTLPADLADRARDLARREVACCAFLEITTTVAGDEIHTDIRSADPAAWPVITALAGLG